MRTLTINFESTDQDLILLSIGVQVDDFDFNQREGNALLLGHYYAIDYSPPDEFFELENLLIKYGRLASNERKEEANELMVKISEKINCCLIATSLYWQRPMFYLGKKIEKIPFVMGVEKIDTLWIQPHFKELFLALKQSFPTASITNTTDKC